MKVITETKVKIRKPRHCWGCKIEYPVGDLMNRVVSVDGRAINTAYWCKTCDDYLAKHRHEIDFDNGFDYGDLLNFEDYIPFNEAVNAK
jgi:hypothetical protein